MALEQLSDVVQRCGALPEDRYAPGDYELFQVSGRACIEEGEGAQVLSLLVDDRNKNIVRCMGWNLLGPVVRVLLKKEEKHLPQCLSILTHLLEVCSPKELLIGLLEQVEEASPEDTAETLLLLLTPLQTVLQRMGVGKASSLGLVLSSVLEQVGRLPAPRTPEQEEEDVLGMGRCLSALLGFTRPFVQEARERRERREGGERGEGEKVKGTAKEDELRTELLKFCMKALCEPLLAVRLSDADTLPDSPLRAFATHVLGILSTIGEPLPDLLCRPLLGRRGAAGFLEEEACYPRAALASLAHLLFVRHIAMETFPAVFSPVFILQCNMEYVNLLLSRREESRLEKGLDLYEKSLVRLEDGSLPVQLLELKSFFSVPQNLVKVMTLGPEQHLRTKGLKVFQLSIDKFDMEAKYKFFQCMLKTSHHAGVEGYIIKNIRTQIDLALKPGQGNPWFLGAALVPLLHQVLSLPQGPETDLLQNLDRIMESLNLLRYLLIRDKENQTAVWAELGRVEEGYLRPLRVGINMSRAHYQAELGAARDARRTGGRASQSPVCSVTVGDETLPNMTPDMQLQVLHSAVHTFGMMESVLARVEELMELKNKP